MNGRYYSILRKLPEVAPSSGLRVRRVTLIVNFSSRKNVASRNSLSRIVTRLWPFILAMSTVLSFGRVNRPLIITMFATTRVKASLTIDISRGSDSCNLMCSNVRSCATL